MNQLAVRMRKETTGPVPVTVSRHHTPLIPPPLCVAVPLLTRSRRKRIKSPDAIMKGLEAVREDVLLAMLAALNDEKISWMETWATFENGRTWFRSKTSVRGRVICFAISRKMGMSANGLATLIGCSHSTVLTCIYRAERTA